MSPSPRHTSSSSTTRDWAPSPQYSTSALRRSSKFSDDDLTRESAVSSFKRRMPRTLD